MQELTAREQEMVARIQKEQEDNMSEMDKAKELLKMKTVKIQRAAPQEVGRLLKEHRVCNPFAHF